jgi:DNA-directed RNA polymerase specialized sigma24 family protein
MTTSKKSRSRAPVAVEELPRQTAVTSAFLESAAFLKKFLARFLSVQQDIEDGAQEAYLRAYVAEQRQSIVTALLACFD